MVWSLKARLSEWVGKELNAARSFDYTNKLKKLVLRLDDEPLPPIELSDKHWEKVGMDNIYGKLENLVKNLNVNFDTQMTTFRKDIVNDYENPPGREERIPVISDFRKFDGYRFYVQQTFILNKSQKERISDYILSYLTEKIANTNEINNLKTIVRGLKTEFSNEMQDPKIVNAFNMFKGSVEELEIEKYLIKEEGVSENAINEINSIFRTMKKAKLSSLKLHNLRISSDDKEKLKKARKNLTKLKGVKNRYSLITEREMDLHFMLKQNLIPIIGDYGSGKSALCHFLIYKLSKDFPNDTIPLFIPLGRLPKYDVINDNMLSDIYNYIINEYGFRLSIEDYYTYVESGRIIFILDALDEMTKRLAPELAQHNLEQAIEISNKCLTVITSRQTYFNEKMERKLLINYSGFLRICDFSDEEIKYYLRLHLNNELNRVNEIYRIIESNNLKDLARKPLFLSVITSNFDKLKEYFPINESVILKVLTEGWIKHDVLKKENIVDRGKIILERQRISEILAIAAYKTENRPIARDTIQEQVKMELGYDDAEAINRLSQYYKDALTSTFLIREENETYRFILYPVIEYFFARRIVNDIKNKKSYSFLENIDLIKTPETFEFIKGIIDIEWAIKPHVFSEIPELKDSKNLRNYENYSRIVVDAIENLKNKKSSKAITAHNLLKILYMTTNLPHRPDLSGLSFQKVSLTCSNFMGAKLHKVDFTDSDLSGSNFQYANLTECILKNAKLTGADLTGADLTGADLTGADLTGADLTGAYMRETVLSDCLFYDVNFTYSKIINCVTSLKTRFNHSDFSYSTISNMDFSKCFLSQSIFMGVNCKDLQLPRYLHRTNFRNADLSFKDLRESDLTECDFRDSNLDGINFSNARLNRSDFRWAKFRKAIVFGAEMDGVNLYGADTKGTEFSSATRFSSSIN